MSDKICQTCHYWGWTEWNEPGECCCPGSPKEGDDDWEPAKPEDGCDWWAERLDKSDDGVTP